MSAIFNDIKSKSVSFRKTKDVLSPTSTFIISEIQKENKAKSKNGVEPEITDDTVITVLKREIKKENGLISVIEKQKDMDNHISEIKNRIAFYETFLPTETSKEEILYELNKVVSEKNMKQMGKYIKHLKDTFGNSLNTSMASSIVRDYLKE